MKNIMMFADNYPEEYNLLVVRQPDVPAAERDVEEIVIPGRDGSLLIDNKRYNNIEIAIDFNYVGREENWGEKWREAKMWLSARNARLSFSDDSGYFYRVKYVKLSNNQRKTTRIGYFTATFVCEPYLYLLPGTVEDKQALKETCLCTVSGKNLLLTTGQRILSQIRRATIRNKYEMCKPVYRIVGKGTCVLSVNHNNFALLLDNEMIIDTEKEMAYSKAGILNTSLAGDYAGLSLMQGINVIECNGECDVYITPNWREL